MKRTLCAIGLAALCLPLLVATPRRAGADDCKPDGVSCKTNQSCCTGVCTGHVCGAPTTTTSTSTTTTSSTTTTTIMMGCPLPATGAALTISSITVSNWKSLFHLTSNTTQK